MHLRLTFLILSGFSLLTASPLTTWAGTGYYVQTNLASDVPGMAAWTDPNLKNPWGISYNPTGGPFWVSNQGSGTSTLYNGQGVPFPPPPKGPLVVTIPPGGGAGNPTGQVFNGTSGFALPSGGSAAFIFATLNGTLTGWNGGNSAQLAATVANASFTGLTMAQNGSNSFLYAVDHAGGVIDVFNSSFRQTTLNGSFTDPNLPSGMKPYGIQSIGNVIYVTYSGGGGGVVDAFGADGTFLHRVAANGAGGALSSPWGVALAPAHFGKFSNDLLVGNVGSGVIDVYNPKTRAFLGMLTDKNGNPIVNQGLWGLIVGNGGLGGDTNKLYFTAGINGYADGLFGSLRAAPEPSTALLGGIGALLLCGFRYLQARRH